MYSLLRFAGITLQYNPKELVIVKRKKISEYTSIGKQATLENINEEPTLIKGVGELFGENCFKMYEKLMRLQIKNSSQKLCIPDISVCMAVLTKFSAKASSRENLIVIDFEFHTVSESSCKKITKNSYTTIQKGETLWDVSYRCDVPVEKLIELNTDIRNILVIEEGKKVLIR